MRPILFLSALFVLLQTYSFAQDESERTPLPKSDRVVVSIFHDVWKGLPQGMESKGLNRGISMQFMYDLPIGNSFIALAAGGGFSSHNLYSNSMPVDEMNNGLFTGRTIFKPIDSLSLTPSTDYSINKLNVNYLEIPVELRMRFRTGNSYLKFTLGAKAGALVNAHTKYKGDHLSGLAGKEKTKNFMIRNTDWLRYSAYGRIAWSGYGVFYSVQLSDLFIKGEPAMAPMSMGVSFSW